MVLEGMESISISQAIQKKKNTDFLTETRRALLQAGVDVNLVDTMQTNINSKASNSHDIQRAIFNEFCKMLDAGKPSFTPKKGKTSVIMFVGLPGSGKTTACTKYAYYHQKQDWKPALICADTFRAGAFDQLKQNASKAKIPFYGRYTESDPVKIAVEGVERFKKDNCDLIIIDTFGCHKQEASLFKKMCQISEATKPDLVIYVMDGSIGQSAFNHAQAFKQRASVGAVVVTKMDGHAKGVGGLTAVAATESPIIFIGTGVHVDEFGFFDVKPYVSRLLGMGDCSGFMDKVQEVVLEEQQPELLQRHLPGEVTFRMMYTQLQELVKIPLIFQLFTILMGISTAMLKKKEEQVIRHMNMMDSMTNEELDSSITNPMLVDEARMMRIARGSGYEVREVMEKLEKLEKFNRVTKIARQLCSDLVETPRHTYGYKNFLIFPPFKQTFFLSVGFIFLLLLLLF